MAEPFDPYYVWLGIPPDQQPANHYRLLGIELFETNSDVIDTAASRQTAYLHQLASGPNRKESQKILNEVAAARRCLLNEEQKQKYDTKLKSAVAATEAAEDKVTTKAAEPTFEPLPQIEVARSASTCTRSPNDSAQDRQGSRQVEGQQIQRRQNQVESWQD